MPFLILQTDRSVALAIIVPRRNSKTLSNIWLYYYTINFGLLNSYLLQLRTILLYYCFFSNRETLTNILVILYKKRLDLARMIEDTKNISILLGYC